MGFLPTSQHNQTTYEYLAERALRRPSSTIWLNLVSVYTNRFDEALSFYVSTLGLTLRTVEVDPSHPSRLHAILVDAEDRDILELIESEESTGTSSSIGDLRFSLPRRAWLLLRARLDAQEYPYRLGKDVLNIKDVDGLTLHVSALY